MIPPRWAQPVPAPRRRAPTRSIRWALLDTFDWRLHGAAQVMVHDGDRLIWHADEAQVAAAPPPRFAADLPARWQGALAPVLAVRALYPRVVLVGEGHTAKDGSGGGTFEAVDPETGQRAPLGPLQWGAEAEATTGLMELALAALGRQAGDYHPRPHLPMEGDEPAAVVSRRLLHHLRTVIELNEAGLRADLDPEFNHDYRVAIRRTRAALKSLRGVFPKRAMRPFAEGFRWLGRVTSPLRDLDVFLIRLPEYRADLAPEHAAALDPLMGLLEALQRTEHAAMTRALDAPAYDTLKADWRRWLDRGKAVGAAGHRPIALEARSRTEEAWSRVLTAGRAISDDSPAEALHELRKDCKIFRYLMEFFRALYEPEAIQEGIRLLKQLQRVLGDFQDFAVQSEALGILAEDLCACGAPPETQAAMDALRAMLTERGARARAEFAASFARFEAASDLYPALFAAPRPAD